MIATAAAKYQEVAAKTSTPGELLLALYDGLFRFLLAAKHGLENGQRARASELINRCHAIISELFLALDHKQSPELCGRLAAVYDFCLSRLTEANLSGSAAKIDEVIRVLTPLREAWRIAVPKAQAEFSQQAQQGKKSG